MHQREQQGCSGEARQALDALGKGGIEARWASGRAGALELALSLIMPRDTVGVGGSVTLDAIGLTEALRSGKLHGGTVTFLDQYRRDLSGEESLSLRHKSLESDIFFSGTNAVTTAGELVNMDGYGNRVAALAFGPKRVCIVAGVNKLVADLPAALARIRGKAAPLNCRRLNRQTPCATLGRCDERNCAAPERICNVLSVIRRQPGGNRITVILVGEELGY
ncbi:MAG: lactate utilization protein [Candidatus Aureabacteria bacterium]|nr:lactate utilization protein [Candidatus Auribacterota bacterium]